MGVSDEKLRDVYETVRSLLDGVTAGERWTLRELVEELRRAVSGT